MCPDHSQGTPKGHKAPPPYGGFHPRAFLLLLEASPDALRSCWHRALMMQGIAGRPVAVDADRLGEALYDTDHSLWRSSVAS